MPDKFDILGIGCIAVDDIFYVDQYPAADSKVRAKRMERRFGGLTGVALVTAAKMGARCAFGGLLGCDELSTFVERQFHDNGIDTTPATRISGASPIRSVVIVDASTRTIVYDASGATNSEFSGPSEDTISDCRVLFLDSFDVPQSLRAAKIAKRHGVPIVADFESDVGMLLWLADHLIVGESYGRQIMDDDGLRSLWCVGRNAVVVTRGERGATYLSIERPGEEIQAPAFAVNAVDTTGCGDVFHGAYAAALAQNRAMEDRIRIASAAAASKAQTGEIPTRQELDLFLSKHLP
jgi:sulfofructose kinase